jgi:hypothetical protein
MTLMIGLHNFCQKNVGQDSASGIVPYWYKLNEKTRVFINVKVLHHSNGKF